MKERLGSILQAPSRYFFNEWVVIALLNAILINSVNHKISIITKSFNRKSFWEYFIENLLTDKQQGKVVIILEQEIKQKKFQGSTYLILDDTEPFLSNLPDEVIDQLEKTAPVMFITNIEVDLRSDIETLYKMVRLCRQQLSYKTPFDFINTFSGRKNWLKLVKFCNWFHMKTRLSEIKESKRKVHNQKFNRNVIARICPDETNKYEDEENLCDDEIPEWPEQFTRPAEFVTSREKEIMFIPEGDTQLMPSFALYTKRSSSDSAKIYEEDTIIFDEPSMVQSVYDMDTEPLQVDEDTEAPNTEILEPEVGSNSKEVKSVTEESQVSADEADTDEDSEIIYRAQTQLYKEVARSSGSSSQASQNTVVTELAYLAETEDPSLVLQCAQDPFDSSEHLLEVPQLAQKNSSESSHASLNFQKIPHSSEDLIIPSSFDQPIVISSETPDKLGAKHNSVSNLFDSEKEQEFTDVDETTKEPVEDPRIEWVKLTPQINSQAIAGGRPNLAKYSTPIARLCGDVQNFESPEHLFSSPDESARKRVRGEIIFEVTKNDVFGSVIRAKTDGDYSPVVKNNKKLDLSKLSFSRPAKQLLVDRSSPIQIDIDDDDDEVIPSSQVMATFQTPKKALDTSSGSKSYPARTDSRSSSKRKASEGWLNKYSPIDPSTTPNNRRRKLETLFNKEKKANNLPRSRSPDDLFDFE